MTDALDAPLLQSAYSPNNMSSSRNNNIEWPTESAERVKLIIPSEWKSNSEFSILRWDVARRLVLVVSIDEPDHVLDAIDPDDMIGVDWQLQLKLHNNNQVRALSKERSETNEPLSEIAQDTQGSATLTIFSYPRKDPSETSWANWCGISSFNPKPNPSYQRPADPSKLGDRYAHHRKFTLAPTEDLQDCNALLAALRNLAIPSAASTTTTIDNDNSSSPIKKYLIVVNPRSGPKRNAAVLCEQQVQPMLEQAGIQCDVCVTTHSHHAEERMLPATATATSTAGPLETDVSEYTGLILMGGDGVIHEALNGIMARPDSAVVLQKLVVGVIGCGTSNGFATSLMLESKERYGLTNETFLICKGKSVWTDLSQYTVSDKSYISFLTYSWAMVADIDLESEAIHFMGEARFDVWAVWRCMFLRRYRARFSYLPASAVQDKTKPMDHMPALQEAVPTDWVTVEDNFLLFWASHVSHAAMHTHHSPRSHLQDHTFQVLTVRGDHISRYRMVRILLGLETGSHVNMPGVEFVECVAYRLEHLTAGSFNDIDGEQVEDGPVQAHVLPAAFQVFCNPQPKAAAAGAAVV